MLREQQQPQPPPPEGTVSQQVAWAANWILPRELAAIRTGPTLLVYRAARFPRNRVVRRQCDPRCFLARRYVPLPAQNVSDFAPLPQVLGGPGRQRVLFARG